MATFAFFTLFRSRSGSPSSFAMCSGLRDSGLKEFGETSRKALILGFARPNAAGK